MKIKESFDYIEKITQAINLKKNWVILRNVKNVVDYFISKNKQSVCHVDSEHSVDF